MKTHTRLALLTLLFAVAVHAKGDGTVSLSPEAVMLTGDYGQSTTHTLTLRNDSSRAFSFDLQAHDVVTTDGKRTFVEAGTIAGSIAATAVFSPRHVEVPPGGTASVTLTVTLPRSTSQRAIVAFLRGTNRLMNGKTPITTSLGTLLTFSPSDGRQSSATPLPDDIHTGPSR